MTLAPAQASPSGHEGPGARTVAWVVAALLLALLLGLHALTRPWAPSGTIALTSARVSLPHDPGLPPRTVALPHVLDDEGPAWWGVVRYELDWPAALSCANPQGARLALLLPRVGTRLRVLLNGEEIYQFGWTAPAQHTLIGTAVPHDVPLPPPVLAARAADNRLAVEVQARVLERSGLWPAVLGPQTLLQERHQSLLLWLVTGSWVMAALALFIGTLALLLWRSLHERLFLLIALASLAHGLRAALVTAVEPPLTYELLLLRWSAFGVYVAFFVLTIEELFGGGLRWVRQGAWITIVLTPVWIGAAL